MKKSLLLLFIILLLLLAIVGPQFLKMLRGEAVEVGDESIFRSWLIRQAVVKNFPELEVSGPVKYFYYSQNGTQQEQESKVYWSTDSVTQIESRIKNYMHSMGFTESADETLFGGVRYQRRVGESLSSVDVIIAEDRGKVKVSASYFY